MHEFFMEHLLRIENILSLNDQKLSQTYVDFLIKTHLFLSRQIMFFNLSLLILLFKNFLTELISLLVGSIGF